MSLHAKVEKFDTLVRKLGQLTPDLTQRIDSFVKDLSALNIVVPPALLDAVQNPGKSSTSVLAAAVFESSSKIPNDPAHATQLQKALELSQMLNPGTAQSPSAVQKTQSIAAKFDAKLNKLTSATPEKSLQQKLVNLANILDKKYQG